MDIAKRAPINLKTASRTISLIFSLPGYWLIYYLLFINPDATLPEFELYRNKFFSIYAFGFVVIGLFILFRGNKYASEVREGEDPQYKAYKSFIPGLIQGILLVTFSYSIANLIRDLFNLF